MCACALFAISPLGAQAGRAREAAAPRPLNLLDLAAPTFTTFTARDGVPESVIVALATDSQGFVWLASPTGLARYDGHRWEAVPPTQFEGQALDLFLDHEHTLWAALFDKGIAHFDGARWQRESRETGLPTDHFRRIVEAVDAAGRVELWALSWDGALLRRVENRWRPDPGNGLPKDLLISLTRTHEIGGRERLWVATGNDGLWSREEGGGWQRFRPPGFDVAQVEDLLVTRHGGQEELWIATFGIGLWRLTDRGVTSWTLEKGDLQSNLTYRLAATTLPDGDRIVWVATRNGLVRVHGDNAQVFDRRHGLPSNVIRNLHRWRSPSGNDVLWIATEAGVARTVTGASGWHVASLMGSNAVGVSGSLVEPDGRGGERLWVASSQGGLGLYEDGRWRTFNAANSGLPLSEVRVVKRTPDETGRAALWVAGDGGELFRVNDEAPRLTRFKAVSTPWPKQVNESVMDVMARTVDGHYERWVATRQAGIFRWRAGRWTAFRPEAAVGLWRVVKLVEQVGRDGRSWLWATTNQGLARFDGAQWSLLGLAAGLPDAELLDLSLLPDRDGRAVLWAGSSHAGIIRIDVSNPREPRVLPSGEIPRPPDNTVYSAQRDSKGRIYIATNNGVQLLVPDSSAPSGFRERVFRRRDGMVHEECNTDAQRIDAHDRYWTGTLGGLAVYDPESDQPSRRAKPLRLTHVSVDGRDVSPAALDVPPGVRELRFEFALLAWQREGDSRFRTQLLGYEPKPTPWLAQNDRLFGSLPPGRYVLRIEGRDYEGLQSPPLEIPVRVQPAWWQQFWLRVTGGAILVLAGPLFYLYRVRRLSRQKAELERVVAERTAALAAANDQLGELSRQDPLTGVANRRRLDEAFEEEWRRALRKGTRLSFLLLDVDHFKAYNDHLGHQSGDVCLEKVARSVAEAHLRAGEVVARYGGEEFGVLIPGITREEALACAEHDRRRVAQLALPHPGSDAAPVVTVSIGVASAQPAEGSSPADLVRAADRALYRAKRDGRNCVRAFDADGTGGASVSPERV